jgi:hypothetical protein
MDSTATKTDLIDDLLTTAIETTRHELYDDVLARKLEDTLTNVFELYLGFKVIDKYFVTVRIQKGEIRANLNFQMRGEDKMYHRRIVINHEEFSWMKAGEAV